jgi:hypothetical protein
VDEMDGECSANRGGEKRTKYSLETVKGRDHRKELGIYGEKIENGC